VAEAERVSVATDMSDTVILGLRLCEGVSRANFRRRFGRDLDGVYAHQIADLVSLGLVDLTTEALRLTSRGRLLGNEAFVRFLPSQA
jgi:oxygen-independent coproporphyrinogen-3 oxidase